MQPASLLFIPSGKVVRSFECVHGFRLIAYSVERSSERADAVVVVVVVVVDVAGRRNAKKIQRTAYENYFRSLVLQARDMYFTSLAI